MKRITTIIIVFFCTFLQMNAQIQRTFFGLELGKATIQDVKNYCKSVNQSAIVYKKKGYIIVEPSKNKFLFGGLAWYRVEFKFNNGFLSMITFHNKDNFDYTKSESEVRLHFNDLKHRIDNKYHTYLINDTKDELKEEWFYRDGSTLLQIILDKSLSLDSFQVTYMDDMKPSDDL